MASILIEPVETESSEISIKDTLNNAKNDKQLQMVVNIIGVCSIVGSLSQIVYTVLLLSTYNASSRCFDARLNDETAVRSYFSGTYLFLYASDFIMSLIYHYNAHNLAKLDSTQSFPNFKGIVMRAKKQLPLDCVAAITIALLNILYYCFHPSAVRFGVTVMQLLFSTAFIYLRVLIDVSYRLSRSILILVSVLIASTGFYISNVVFNTLCDAEESALFMYVTNIVADFAGFVLILGMMKFAYFRIRRIFEVKHESFFDIIYVVKFDKKASVPL